MKKTTRFSRVLAVLLCAILVLGALFAFSSCKKKCKHENTETTNTATCTAAGVEKVVCKDCGETLSEKATEMLPHNYVADAASSVAPTCTTDGKDVQKCSACGDVKETVIAKLEHKYQPDAEHTVAPTCTSKGTDAQKCSLCGNIVTTEVPQLEHSFKPNETLSKAATCTEAGKTVLTCEHCQQNSETVINATGHKWITEDGSPAVACVDKKCANCDAILPATASHNYSLTSDTATCTEDGLKTYTCSVCNGFYTEPSPKTGHNVEAWGASTKLGLVENETCEYRYSHSGTCTNCGKPVNEEYTSPEHNYSLTVTQPATCTVAGLQEMKCTECGAIKPDAPSISFFAEHTFGEYVDSDEDGKATSTCSECGETRTKVISSSATVNSDELKNEVQLGGTGAVIKMDEETANRAGDNATLSADEFSKGDLEGEVSGDDLAKLGDDDTIYNITLTDETGNPITDFGNGKATVKLPYTLKEGDDPARITIFYLSDSGIEEIVAAFTMTDEDTKSGFVTFETNHFSYYLVGLYSDAELCERFGHELIVAHKDATCTENGYHIESCKRCGKIVVNTPYNALGHNAVVNPDTSVIATCTTPGHEDRECSRCGYSYSVVIQPTGHSWQCTDSQDASCTQSGYRKYECENCTAEYTETIPQLSHSYNKVVTPATCTTQGYTTYSCKTCELTYRTDFVAPYGHRWNIAEPTCAEGQVCLACGANGKPATGNHTMENGKCSVCGLGCSHSWQVKEVIAPTCDLGGYTIHICSICNAEKTVDITRATGHIYTGITSGCSVCGKQKENVAEIFRKIALGFVSDSYAIKLENLQIITEKTTVITGKDPEHTTTVNAEIDLFDVYIIQDEEGRILFSADGTVNITEENYKVTVTVYGDGEYIYIQLINNSETFAPVPETLRISYSDAISKITGIFGGSSEPVYPNGFVMNSPASILEMLEQIIAQATEDGIIEPWIQLVEDNSDEIVTFVGNLIFSCFKSEATPEGFKYTLDLDSLNALNDDLKTLSVAEIIDKHYGEGSFDTIITFLESLETKTLPTAATEFVDLFSGIGIPSELLLDTVNYFVGMCLEIPDFDIMLLLNSNEYKDTTISELVMMLMENMQRPEGPSEYNADGEDEDEPSAYMQMIAQLEAMAKQTIIYNLLEEDTAEQVYEALDAILDTSKLAICFYVDNEGNPIKVDITANNQLCGGGRYKDEAGFMETITNGYANGKLTISLTATLPEGADRIKTEYDAVYDEFEQSVKDAVAALEDSTQIIISTGYETFALTVNEDTVYLIYLDGGLDLKQIPISELAFVITKDCAGCYRVEEENIDFTVYFNAETNTFSARSFHNFANKYTGTIPEGYYSTYEEAPCESYYGEFYVCSCGAIGRNTGWKSHDTYTKATLLPGSVTCEDGVLIELICRSCGELTDTYRSDYHSESLVKRFECDTEHGKLWVEHYACPCGYTSHIEYNQHDSSDGCMFRECSDSTCGDNYCEYTYNCAIEGCSASIVVRMYNPVKDPFNGNPCTYSETYVYKVNYNGSTVYTVSCKRYETMHSMETDENNVHLERCTGCGMERYDERFYDGYNRYTGRKEWTKENGEYTYYFEERYEYTSEGSCECFYGNTFNYNVPVEIDYKHKTTHHSNDYFLVREGTCTQPDAYGYGCTICGENDEKFDYEYNYNYHGNGHSWTSTDDGDEFEYVCTECGLKSNQGNSDICMEDLTSNPDYAVDNSFVIGYKSYCYDHNCMFSFVIKDKNYTDVGSTLPAMDISCDDIKGYPDGNILLINMNSLLESINILIEQGELPEGIDTRDDFLNSYDFAITMQEAQSGDYGNEYEGAYSVLVIEDLASYFN